ncbi:EamA family transporter [Nocardia nova]|uniref:EamA family transporter n=1 Tax=Nocardia nova TaxID=37330 RepID=UPI001893A0F6|nr:DMT family transporter [Nocardia nova]MBF6146163.1 EamA family transporter [Nocardia nova]MDN2499907.1 EamA family transporter [Nocardia nova]
MSRIAPEVTAGDRLGSGTGCAVVSAVSFALSGPLARGLMNAGWSSAAVVIVRVLVGAAALTPIAAVALRNNWKSVRRNAALILCYGLVAIAGVQLAYFTAVSRLAVGMALLIQYTSPIAVVGWLWLRRHQRPAAPTVAGALLGLTGLFFVIDLRSGAATDWIGICWALLAMACGVVYFLLSAHGHGTLPGTVLATGGLLVGGLGLLAAGATGVLPLRATANPVVYQGVTMPWWLPIAILGTVTAALAYVAGIAATRLLGSRAAAFTGLLEVVAALIVAWALLGEAPHPVQLLGGVLVLTGVLIVRRGEAAVSTPISR